MVIQHAGFQARRVLAAVFCDVREKGAVAHFTGLSCVVHCLCKPVVVALVHRTHSRVDDTGARLNSLIAAE